MGLKEPPSLYRIFSLVDPRHSTKDSLMPFPYVYPRVLSPVLLPATSWAVACQAALLMRFSKQEYWSGLPFPPPGDLPHPGIEPRSPAMASGFFAAEPLGKLLPIL